MRELGVVLLPRPNLSLEELIASLCPVTHRMARSYGSYVARLLEILRAHLHSLACAIASTNHTDVPRIARRKDLNRSGSDSRGVRRRGGSLECLRAAIGGSNELVERQECKLQVHRAIGANGEDTEPLRVPDSAMDVCGRYLVPVRHEQFGRSIRAAEHQAPNQAAK